MNQNELTLTNKKYEVYCCAGCLGFTRPVDKCWIANHPVCDVKTYPNEVIDKIADIRHSIDHHMRQSLKERNSV